MIRKVFVPNHVAQKAEYDSEIMYNDLHSYYNYKGALLVLRHGLKIEDVAGKAVKAQVGWDQRPRRTKITIYQTVKSRGRHLDSLLRERDDQK